MEDAATLFSSVIGVCIFAGWWARGSAWAARRLGVVSPSLDRVELLWKTWIGTCTAVLAAFIVWNAAYLSGHASTQWLVPLALPVGAVAALNAAAMVAATFRLRRDAKEQGIHLPAWSPPVGEPVLRSHEQDNAVVRTAAIAAVVGSVLFFLFIVAIVVWRVVLVTSGM